MKLYKKEEKLLVVIMKVLMSGYCIGRKIDENNNDFSYLFLYSLNKIMLKRRKNYQKYHIVYSY